MMLRVKLAEVAPAAITTVEEAGPASVVSLEASVTVVAEAWALLSVTVPVTVPADSSAEEGRLTASDSAAFTEKTLDSPVIEPLVACAWMFEAGVGTVRFPVQTPAENAPVVAGEIVAALTYPKRTSGIVVLVNGVGEEVPVQVSGSP